MSIKCVTCYRYEGVKHLEGRWYKCVFCPIGKFVGRVPSDWIPMGDSYADAPHETNETLIGFINDLGLFDWGPPTTNTHEHVVAVTEARAVAQKRAQQEGGSSNPIVLDTEGDISDPIDLVSDDDDSETEGPEDAPMDADTQVIESDTEEYSQSPRDVSAF